MNPRSLYGDGMFVNVNISTERFFPAGEVRESGVPFFFLFRATTVKLLLTSWPVRAQ